MRHQFRTVFSSVTGIVASVLLLGLILLAIIAPLLWSDQASAINVALPWAPPSGAHWFGTDELGRDIFFRTLVATRLSLICALIASAIAIVIGVPVGLLASVFGPRVAGGFRSVVNVSIAFPALLTAMFVGVIIGIGVPGAVIGVGIALAPLFARLTQTLTASVVSLDYVAAARTMGVPLRRVIRRHILANVAEPLIINATTSVGTALLGISALSFLGLGARPPQYDWGELLSTGLSAVYTSPMAAIGPGIFIALAGISFNLLGEVIAGSFGDNQSSRRVSRVTRAMAAAARRRPVPDAGAKTTAGPKTTAVLDVENLRVSFPAESGELPAVRGISLRIAQAERVGIVGESGSGKSVSVMAIAQLIGYPAVVTADRIRFDGADLAAMPPRARRRFLGSKLAMVFQNPMSSLNPAMRIGVQLTEAARKNSGLSRAAAYARAADRLAKVGIDEAPRRLRQYPHQFSGGMRQRALIAAGLMETPRLIIADEPTTALDVTVQRQILDLLLRINREEETAILLISHDISVIANVCERVIVMYGGLIVEDLPAASLLLSAAHPYTRALIASVPDMETDRSVELATIPGRPPALHDLPPGCTFASRCPMATRQCSEEMPPLIPLADGHLTACWHPQSDTAAVVAAAPRMSGGLAVHGLTVRYSGRTVVDNVDLELTEGRVLGLVGESGSGKSTIARAILGLAPRHAGTITLGGAELPKLARERARLVQMIFQDPFGSLNPRMPVAKIIAEGLEARGDLRSAERDAEVTRLLELVSLSRDMEQRLPRRLSGGQRQRVAIARALAANPAVLIADEITSALDVSVQAQVLNVLRGILATQRLSMLFISHNLAVVRYISDDLAVMRDGVIVEAGPVDEVLAAPRHPYTRELLDAIPHLHAPSTVTTPTATTSATRAPSPR